MAQKWSAKRRLWWPCWRQRVKRPEQAAFFVWSQFFLTVDFPGKQTVLPFETLSSPPSDWTKGQGCPSRYMKYKRHWVERKKQRAAPAGLQYTERFLCEKRGYSFWEFSAWKSTPFRSNKRMEKRKNNLTAHPVEGAVWIKRKNQGREHVLQRLWQKFFHKRPAIRFLRNRRPLENLALVILSKVKKFSSFFIFSLSNSRVWQDFRVWIVCRLDC